MLLAGEEFVGPQPCDVDRGSDNSLRYLPTDCDHAAVRFSEKYGHRPVSDVIQLDTIDDNLRTDLWNFTYHSFTGGIESFWTDKIFDHVFALAWVKHFHEDIDELPSRQYRLDEVKRWFKEAQWYEVYDLVELITESAHDISNGEVDLSPVYNKLLAAGRSGYRLVAHQIAPISDTNEIDTIEEALTVSTDAARHHLQSALSLLADKTAPNFSESVKESISAVEAKAKAMDPAAKTLGEALKTLKNRKDGLFPDNKPLFEAWEKMYGFANSEAGVRHAGRVAPNVSQAFAQYFLIACSAFINLLTSIEAA